jgi:hypothetical protein
LSEAANRTFFAKVQDTIRAKLDLWKKDVIKEIYSIFKKKKKILAKMENLALHNFTSRLNIKKE